MTNKYIAIILEDRAKILKEIEAVTAPYKAILQEANKALSALGYNDKHFNKPIEQMSMFNSDLPRPTIKQRVRQALTEEYPNGAHYSNILEYINKKWPHMAVKRTSLSPQLTRLRKANIIELNEDKGIWYLVDTEKENSTLLQESAVGSEG